MMDDAFDWALERLPHFITPAIAPLRAEASFRAFYRISSQGAEPETAVLMISPPEKEQNDQFETLARVFAAANIPVPEIMAANRPSGWYLLSDLGDRELADMYGTDHEPDALRAAICTLIRLQTVSDAAVPRYTAERFGDELGIFTEWFVEGMLDLQAPAALRPVFEDLVGRTATQAQCCVHRDYHCRNLLYDPASDQLGVVDFQDALRGPATYDLASLLHDCYHRFSEPDVARWTGWYLEHTPLDLDPIQFAIDLDHMAVQRQLKAVGIFARLRLRDGKSTHLDYIQPVLDQLLALSRRHNSLDALSEWLEDLDQGVVEKRISTLDKR